MDNNNCAEGSRRRGRYAESTSSSDSSLHIFFVFPYYRDKEIKKMNESDLSLWESDSDSLEESDISKEEQTRRNIADYKEKVAVYDKFWNDKINDVQRRLDIARNERSRARHPHNFSTGKELRQEQRNSSSKAYITTYDYELLSASDAKINEIIDSLNEKILKERARNQHENAQELETIQENMRAIGASIDFCLERVHDLKRIWEQVHQLLMQIPDPKPTPAPDLPATVNRRRGATDRSAAITTPRALSWGERLKRFLTCSTHIPGQEDQ